VTARVSVGRAYFCSSAVAATMASGESVPTRQGGMRVVVMDAPMRAIARSFSARDSRRASGR
jgi:hypothetical protein